MGRVFSGSRGMASIVYRDPEHVAERLTLYAVDRLADRSRAWAQTVRDAQPDVPRAQLVEDLRVQSAQIARIDGAISGTPFFIALVPGYLTYLMQEMRMTLNTAALYGRDPAALRTAAEMLALRGVRPDVEQAEAALLSVEEAPERPARRRSLRTWVDSGFTLLVFGGFLSPSTGESPGGVLARIRAVASFIFAALLWAVTWILPVTFMIMMAWGCEAHTRQLGRRALVFYEGGEESISEALAQADRKRDHGHDKRAVLRAVALFLSVAIPIGFLAFVIHVNHFLGINPFGYLGALVALSLVIATVVLSGRT